MHYSVIVIGEDVEAQLEQYAEDLEVEEYLVGVVSDEDKQIMIDFYTDRGEKFDSFCELYERCGYDWNGGGFRKDADGVWREYSTRNPYSQWDWYVVGGRWAGRLKVKEGVEYEAPQFSCGWSEDDKKEILSERRTDSALIKDIENLDELSCYAVIKDGEWIGNGYDGLQKERVQELLEDVPEDERITFVDCHI